jgi:hypothetical protein
VYDIVSYNDRLSGLPLEVEASMPRGYPQVVNKLSIAKNVGYARVRVDSDIRCYARSDEQVIGDIIEPYANLERKQAICPTSTPWKSGDVLYAEYFVDSPLHKEFACAEHSFRSELIRS